MPTKKRQESQTGFYHVIGKGINNEKIFEQQREKVYFKRIFSKFLKKYNVEIYAYCIMSNHFHVVIKSEIQELSSFMARVLAEYANYYNFKHHRNGHVFQNRFTSECIESEGYFWNCIRYIHNNPVKAGMVKKAIRYKFSSMGEYITETLLILHSKAVVAYKEKFLNKKDFEEFHMQRQYMVFNDIQNEMAAQQLEVAVFVAEKIYEQRKMQLLIQVFEEKKTREEYIEELRHVLKVSKRKAKELCNVIHNQVENA